MRHTTSWITAWVVCGLMTSAIHGQENDAEELNALVAQQADQVKKQELRAREAWERATRHYELTLANAELAKMGSSKYWIGIGIEDASDSLRSQLGLADRGAIVVTMVAEKGPGEEAGLKVHDVLTHIKAGDEEKDLKEVGDLTGIVTKAEKTPLKLTFLRQGKSHEVTVTPTERPQPKQDQAFNAYVGIHKSTTGNPERVAELLKELNALVGQQPKPVSVHFTGPVVMPPPVVTTLAPAPANAPFVAIKAQPELPENVAITITKTGKEPTRVQYKQGEGKVWGATEKELDTLPPEGRRAIMTVTNGLLQQASGRTADPAPHRASLNMIRSEYPVPFVYQLKDGATGGITLTAPAPATQTTKTNPTADRLSQLEKQMELLQKQQQEMLHILRKTLDQTEKR
jgi:hypothetical protein